MQAFSKYNKYLLTVVDIFSKYGWMIPLKNKTGTEVADSVPYPSHILVLGAHLPHQPVQLTWSVQAPLHVFFKTVTCLVTWALDNAPGYDVYNQTRDVSRSTSLFSSPACMLAFSTPVMWFSQLPQPHGNAKNYRDHQRRTSDSGYCITMLYAGRS